MRLFFLLIEVKWWQVEERAKLCNDRQNETTMS